METLLPIVVQVVTGILGGQAVGAALKQAAMSQLPKIISGALGGVGGAAILGNLLGDPATAGVLGGLLGDAIGGAGRTDSDYRRRFGRYEQALINTRIGDATAVVRIGTERKPTDPAQARLRTEKCEVGFG
jgi:hypothetical protein